MVQLKRTTVKRGGVTSSRWYETIHSVSLGSRDGVQLRFNMSSKGGGYTDLLVEIGPDDFPTLLEAMSLVDRQAAMQAMSLELSRQVRTQPDRNNELRKQTAESIRHLAERKFIRTPSGQDERERTVRDGVSEIVSELKLD
jgi:hypothetical protein